MAHSVFRSGLRVRSVALAAGFGLLVVGCGDGSDTAVMPAQETQQDPCDVNPQSSPTCEGYQDPCDVNPQSSPTCEGYVVPVPGIFGDLKDKPTGVQLFASQSVMRAVEDSDKDYVPPFLLKGTMAKKSLTHVATLKGDNHKETRVPIVTFDSGNYMIDFYTTGTIEGDTSTTNNPNGYKYYLKSDLGTSAEGSKKLFSIGKDDYGEDGMKTIKTIASQFAKVNEFVSSDDFSYRTLNVSVDTDNDNDKDAMVHAELWTTGGTDYLLGGVWLLKPHDPGNPNAPGDINDYYVGAFAQGDVAYGAVTNPLTGRVTYTGAAVGLHTSSGEGGMVKVSRLLGNVTLMADFETTTARGSIEGSIRDLTLDGKETAGTIILPKATLLSGATIRPVSGTNDVPVEGSLGNIDNINYRGTWLGSFHGTKPGTVTATSYPTGVAGVVSGKATSGSNRFVASFGASKEDDADE